MTFVLTPKQPKVAGFNLGIVSVSVHFISTGAIHRTIMFGCQCILRVKEEEATIELLSCSDHKRVEPDIHSIDWEIPNPIGG